MPLNAAALTLFFLLGTFVLTTLSESLREIRKNLSKRPLNAVGKLFFYRYFQRYFFPKKEIETLFTATVCAKRFVAFCYAIPATIMLINQRLLPSSITTLWLETTGLHTLFFTLFVILLFVSLSLLIGDFLPRVWTASYPKTALKLSTPIASIFLFLTFPLSFLFLKLSNLLARAAIYKKRKESPSLAKEKIISVIQDAIASTKLEPNEKKLIESVVSFKDRVVREVMVPRVDLFTLSSGLTLREAAAASLKEGYSRIPVFEENIDNIIGLLMYKDVLALYINSEGNEEQLDKPIKTIVKPILYTPETKKISHLLQEFRNKQMHLAIVVDEYGGTEGIVTIEDILEEIVGEIEDEYDNEEKLFSLLPHGGWVLDARMGILEIEEQLGIKIPQDGDYDTIGGYIFHRSGSIPSRGLLIHHDDFELEILSSNDRSIKKVRITPITSNPESGQQGNL